jgi:hypothetical protein
VRDDGVWARIMAAVTEHDTAAGAHAGFSLPLTVGPGGIGMSDLRHDRPGVRSEEYLADVLVAVDIARNGVLYQQHAPAWQARPRAAAFASGRPMYDVARAVVERRVRLDE